MSIYLLRCGLGDSQILDPIVSGQALSPNIPGAVGFLPARNEQAEPITKVTGIRMDEHQTLPDLKTGLVQDNPGLLSAYILSNACPSV